MISNADKQGNELLAFKDKYGLDELGKFKSRKELELKILQEYLDKGLLAEKDAIKVRAILASEEFTAKTKDIKDFAEQFSQIASNGANAFQGFQQAEEKSIETKYQKQIDAARKAGKDTTKIEEQKNKELADLRAKNADAMFALQVASIIASTAVSAIDAYASALKIPVAGLFLAPIAAAAAVAYGASQVAIANSAREAAKAGYADGGFTTPGDKYKPVGVVHAGEFVAAQESVKNPNIRPVLDLFDYAQRNGTVSSLSKSDISKALRLSPGYSDGGFSPAVRKSGSGKTEPTTADYMLAMVTAINRLNNHLDEGIATNLSISGDNGVAKKLDDYNKLINNSKR